MGTVSPMPQSEVTIHAKHPESRGKSLVFKPVVELSATSHSYLLAMLDTAAVDMVNGKKLHMSLATAETEGTAICLKSSQLTSIVMSLAARLNSLRILLPPSLLGCASSIWISFPPSFHSRSMLFKVSRQLWRSRVNSFGHKNSVSQPTSTLLHALAGRRRHICIITLFEKGFTYKFGVNGGNCLC